MRNSSQAIGMRAVALLQIAFPLALCGMPAVSVDAQGPPEVSAQPAWQLHRRGGEPEAGYVVYKRKPLGSKYFAYRLEAVLLAPLELVAAASRKDGPPESRPKNIDFTVLREDEDVRVVYSYIHLPLIADRDITTRMDRSYDAATETHRIAWRVVDEGPPPKKGVVRLRKSDGAWEFSPEGDEQTRVIYETHTEVAGSMPAWLVNSMTDDSILDGFQRLLEKVELERQAR